MATTQGPGRQAWVSGDRPYPGVRADRRSDLDRGSSLIEILVSVVLLGLVGTAVLTAFGMATRGSALSGDLAAEQSSLTAAHDLIVSQPYVDCTHGDPALAHGSIAASVGVTVEAVEYWDGTGFASGCLPKALQRITLRVADGGGRTLQIAHGSRVDLPHDPAPIPPDPPEEPGDASDDPTDPPDDPAQAALATCRVDRIVPRPGQQPDGVVVTITNSSGRQLDRGDWTMRLVYDGSGSAPNSHYDTTWSGGVVTIRPSSPSVRIAHDASLSLTISEPRGSTGHLVAGSIPCTVEVTP